MIGQDLKLGFVTSVIVLGISLIFTSLTKLADMLDEFFPRYLSWYVKLFMIMAVLIVGIIILAIGVKALKETLVAGRNTKSRRGKFNDKEVQQGCCVTMIYEASPADEEGGKFWRSTCDGFLLVKKSLSCS